MLALSGSSSNREPVARESCRSERANRAGATPLRPRCESATSQVVNLLLQAGADPNAAEMPAVVTPCTSRGARHAGIAQTLLRHPPRWMQPMRR